MKLYITATSPYARIVRILILEKNLSDQVDIVLAKTRTPDSPFYQINVSGRVPFLLHDDGWGMEDSYEICAYLDQLDGQPLFVHAQRLLPETADGWRQRQLQARATSLIDSVSVWIRELRRPPADQSATIIEHERTRALRLAEWWQQNIDDEVMQGRINLTQTTLFCALDLDNAIESFTWRQSCPALVAFADKLAEHESVAASSPYT